MSKLTAASKKIKDTVRDVYRSAPWFFQRGVVFLMLYAGYGVLFQMLSERATGQFLYINDGLALYINYIFYALFTVLTFRKIRTMPAYRQDWKQTILFLCIAVAVAYYPALYFLAPNTAMRVYAFLTTAFVGQLCVFLAVFNFRFLKRLFFEISLTLIMIVIFYLSSVMIEQHWEYSSYITFLGLSLILPLVPVTYSMDISIFEVTVNNFTVFIGPPCAGIHSLMTFAVLFLIWIFLTMDRQTFAWGRVALTFILGIIGVFILNSLRVALILLVGVWYSEEFAVNAFHHNIGAILLILFIIVFFKFATPWMRKR